MKTKKKLLVFLFSVIILVGVLGSVSALIENIIVTNPNEGAYSHNIPIQWTAQGCVVGDKIKIYWGKGGTIGNPVEQGYVSNDVDCSLGTYLWDVLNRESRTDYQMRIKSSLDSDIYDNSNDFFTIDNTPPIITDDYGIKSGQWQNEEQTITLNPSDAVSEIDIVKYCEGIGCDPADGDILDAPYEITYGSTDTILRYGVRDKAGNPSEIGEVNIKIDLDVPTTISVGGKPEGLIVSQAGITAFVSECVDEESGCDILSYKYKLYPNDPGICSETYNIDYTTDNSVTGHKWVCAAAKDNVGNIGYSSPEEFTIYNNIQDAITAANAGDTINVASGTYNEQLTINKNNLIIQSTDGAETTIINVTDKGTSNGGVIFNGNGNTFDGFTIIDFTDSPNENKIIRVNSNNNTIKNNVIQGNLNQGVTGHTEYGILFQSTASGNLIDSNEVFDIGDIGINVYGGGGASENTISNNNVHDIGKYAITVDRSPDNNVTGNDISDLVGGVLNLNGDGSVNVDYNCETSCWGIVIWGAGAAGTTIDDQDLIGLPNGIALSSAQEVTVQNSEIANNGIGIKLADSSWIANSADNNIIQYNDIHNNNDGIVIKGGGIGGIGTGNLINYNKIYNNNNVDTGLHNYVATLINAKNNWWGHITGPYHATTNDDGQGNAVSDNVLYTPWAYNVAETGEVLTDGEEPVIVLVEDANVDEGYSIDLDASASYDNGDAGIQSYEWDLDNDGVYEIVNNAENPITTFDASIRNGPDTQIIGIKLTDNSGNVAEKTINVMINNVAPNIDDISADKTYAIAGEPITFTASATDAGNDELIYSWDFDASNGIQEDATGEEVVYNYNSGGIYTVTLTVTDDDGADVSDSSIQISINDLFWDLSSDWNLVSSPKRTLQDMEGLSEPRWSYNNGWIENPTTIEPGMGYWISSNENIGLDYIADCEFPKCLPSGKINIDALNNRWNLIGITTTNTTMSASQAFGSMIYPETHLPVYYVIKYDKNYVNSDGSIGAFFYLSGADVMNPGDGYWVYIVK